MAFLSSCLFSLLHCITFSYAGFHFLSVFHFHEVLAPHYTTDITFLHIYLASFLSFIFDCIDIDYAHFRAELISQGFFTLHRYLLIVLPAAFLDEA